jgi:hypothetical protein
MKCPAFLLGGWGWCRFFIAGDDLVTEEAEIGTIFVTKGRKFTK